MPSRSRIRVTLIASLAALVIGTTVGVTKHVSADAASGPIPGTALMRLGNQWSLATNQDKYSYVVVGRQNAGDAAAQPGTSLVYTNAVGVNTLWDAGVPYSVAVANNWLLRDASGTLLRNVSYPDYYIGDVGDPAYANEFARRVGDYLASVGVDGVYIDDVLADIYGLTGGRYPAKYPSQSAWENAIVSFVGTVGSTLKARGFYVMINAHKYVVAGDPGNDNGTVEAQFWQRVGPSVSGLHNEYFLQTPNLSNLRGDGPAWYDNWSGWVNLIGVTQGMNRDFFGMTYGSTSDLGAMRYVRASYLLMWDGSDGGLLYQNESGDPWSAEWTVDIGTPGGGRYQVGVGWRRQYTGGTVVVNPNTSSSQTFSLGGTYLMPDGSSVTSVTLGPKSGLVLRSTGTSVPVNTAPPTVTGSPQQGVLLAATAGTWSGSPTGYAYQWNRCDTSGAACAAISGATNSQYLLAAADVGKTIRMKVTASNSVGSTSATSNATGVVVPGAPSNVTLPAISGTMQQGQTLSSSSGTWTNSPTSYGHQWQRCDSGGNSCAAVAGATAATFGLTATDVGKTLRVVVTATNAGGSAQATSAASAVVTGTGSTATAPSNSSPPTLSGTSQQGKALSASTGTWANAPSSYAYQWRRCDSAGGACANISGATSSSYELTASEVGRTVRVVVTASNAGGSGTATSATSAVVTAATTTTLVAAPVNTAPPVVSGEAQEGQSLAASTGTWSNSPTSHAYQWRRCDSSGAACADISGASGSSYTLASGDVGRTIRVAVTASNARGSATASSAATAVVAPLPVAPPAPTPAPTPSPAEPVSNSGQPNVTGPELVGKTVDASKGSWQGNPTSFAFQWLRCLQEDLASCTPIAGATAASYTVKDDDVDRYVIVKVTATGAGGSSSATSKLGRPIKH